MQKRLLKEAVLANNSILVNQIQKENNFSDDEVRDLVSEAYEERGMLMESLSSDMNAAQMYKKALASRNTLLSILSAIEFDELTVDAKEYDELTRIHKDSKAVLDYLYNIPAQVKPKLDSNLQSIYNDLLNSIDKYKED